MGSSSARAFALKWSYFFVVSSTCMNAFEQYFPLYLQQLGFRASQIGVASLMGIPLLFVPLIGFLVDSFRARKVALAIFLLANVILYIAPLLPLLAPSDACSEKTNTSLANDTKDYWKKSFYFENVTQDFSKTINKPSNENGYISWSSWIFVYIVIMRGLYEILKRPLRSLYNIAVMTHLQNERASFGSYCCWGQIGGLFMFFAVGVTVTLVQQTICGSVSYGYYTTFIWSSLATCMALPVLP